eukprot:9578120-Karenia_brevis.AAC.1
MCIIVAYMPHGGYGDSAVQDMYDQIAQLISVARSEKRLIVLAGDWNAEVASVVDDSACKQAVGRYANLEGNLRGDWLRRWATSE